MSTPSLARRRLTAEYALSIPAIKVKGALSGPSFRTQRDGFEVTLKLSLDGAPRTKSKTERLWTCHCHGGTITVTRTEARLPPPIVRTPTGGRDFTQRVPYFDSLLAEYGPIASSTVRNFCRYVRYRLQQPMPGQGQLAGDPRWTDATGAELPTGRTTIPAYFISQTVDFGGRRLEGADRREVVAALNQERPVELHEELLADARIAAMQGNIRRAVLEIAIAREVFAKRASFEHDSRAARVFEALEDRSRTRVTVPELIDLLGSTSSGGKTFSALHPTAARDLKEIFEARNKVAHRGLALYRTQHGELRDVGRETLVRWWKSVDSMVDWVGRLRP